VLQAIEADLNFIELVPYWVDQENQTLKYF